MKSVSHTSCGRAVAFVILGFLCAESAKGGALDFVGVESLVSDRASRFVLVVVDAVAEDDDADCDAGGCFEMARCN